MAQSLEALYDHSRESTAYMIRQISHICRNLKTRSPGTPGEREAAAYLSGLLRRDCGCRQITTEVFSHHPGAFYGFLYVSVGLGVLTFLSFFFRPWISIVCSCAALLLFVLQFLHYGQIMDVFFPKKQSVNVTALRPCSGPVRRRVFLNGHLDAAWEWPLNYWFGGVVFELPGVFSFLGFVYYLVLGILARRGAGPWITTAARIGGLFLPFWIAQAYLWDSHRVVDGANDNLSGCLMGIALLKGMEDQGITLRDTEVGVILTGAEECGLCGAKAWAKAHKRMSQDVPTMIYCFDTIHDPKYLMTNERDLNGTVRADRDMSDVFFQAAAELGIPCRRGWVPPMGGGTDSAAFTRGGFRSVGITGLNHCLEDYYHTRRDTCDNLNPEGLENCFKAAVRTLELIDAGVLDSTPQPKEGVFHETNLHCRSPLPVPGAAFSPVRLWRRIRGLRLSRSTRL